MEGEGVMKNVSGGKTQGKIDTIVDYLMGDTKVEEVKGKKDVSPDYAKYGYGKGDMKALRESYSLPTLSTGPNGEKYYLILRSDPKALKKGKDRVIGCNTVWTLGTGAVLNSIAGTVALLFFINGSVILSACIQFLALLFSVVFSKWICEKTAWNKRKEWREVEKYQEEAYAGLIGYASVTVLMLFVAIMVLFVS